MIYAGIDYSMTCPSICVSKLENCYTVDYLTNIKKFEGAFSASAEFHIYGHPHKDYSHEIDRFNNLALWSMHCIPHESQVYLEDYAMGARGRVFSIGENTAILKYKLRVERKQAYKVIAPTAVKKFATGKGNADKDAMYEAFYEQTKIDLFNLFSVTSTKSPVSDIVDSYFLCKMSQDKI